MTEERAFRQEADIFPMMDDDALLALAADIQANGLREAIWLHPDGTILDGRNRYLACKIAGAEPQFREWDGRGDPIAFVVSLNRHRRHLNESQLAMVAAKIANLRHGTNQHRKEEGDISPSSPTIQEAADLVGVSRSSVVKAKTVLREGTPEEVKAVEAGEVAVGTLAADLKAGVPEEGRGLNKPKATGKSGARVALPVGETMESMCRRGIAMTDGGATDRDAAKAVNMDHRVFSQLRDVVLLSDREDLASHEMVAVHAALAAIIEARQIGPHYEAVRPIADRVWGASDERRAMSRGRAEEVRRQTFDRAFGTLLQAYNQAPEILVPHLSPGEAKKAAAQLGGAIASVKKLRARILEMHDEQAG